MKTFHSDKKDNTQKLVVCLVIHCYSDLSPSHQTISEAQTPHAK